MSNLYPMLFTPVFQERVWGGRRLARYFSSLPEGMIGEAWLVSAHSEGVTPISNGPLAGETLPALCRRLGPALLGAWNGDFPLLVKLLGCQDHLSV